MTGWIKMGTGLRDHPKVVRMAGMLKADCLKVVGALHAVWSVFDEHSPDGLLEFYTLRVMDEKVGWRGFSQAMQAVGWLIESEHGLEAPDYEEHNGPSAKRRALDTRRKSTTREADKSANGSWNESGNLSADDADSVSGSDADKSGTRVELDKSKSNNPLTPLPGKKSGPVSLRTWLEAVKAKGEKAVPEGDPLFAYAESAGIPREFLALAWLEFKDRYTQPDAKLYRDWRATFRNAVKGNWLKLWYADGGTYCLTTVGVQAQRVHGGERAA